MGDWDKESAVVWSQLPFQWLWRCVSLWRQMRRTRNGCRRSCRHRPLLWHSHGTWQRLKDSRNALVVSCGDVQVGDRGRSNSKETLRALACRRFSSSLPEGALLSTAHPAVHLEMRRWTMVAPTKKQNAKRRSPLHKKDLLRIGANVGSEMFSRSAVWRRIEWVHQSADNKTTT